ncbi:MAG: hypothetical protein WCJ13_09805 [Coriobacteriia bacterium]
MNRPTGVTILGWVAVVFGAIGLVMAVMGVFAAIALMALGAGAAGVGAVAGGASLAGGAFLVLALSIWTAALCAVEIAFGAGALQLKPWAWTLGMIWTWVSVATNILSVFANRGSGLIGAIIGILVAIAILYYLYTEEVRAAFGKSDQVAPSFMAPVFEQIDKLVASNKGGAQPSAQSPTQHPGPPTQ